MKITVFGASGRVGQIVVEQALAKGHEVTAFVHKANPFTERREKLHIVQGSFDSTTSIEAALKDAEAIICTLGSWGTKQKNSLTKGMEVIIPAAEAQGVMRIISLTGTGARWSGDKSGVIEFLNRIPLQIVAPAIIKDAEQHMTLLRASSLDWTVIRSPRMTSSDKVAYTLNTRLSSPLAAVSRAAVAASVLDQLEATNFLKQAPAVYQA